MKDDNPGLGLAALRDGKREDLKGLQSPGRCLSICLDSFKHPLPKGSMYGYVYI